VLGDACGESQMDRRDARYAARIRRRIVARHPLDPVRAPSRRRSSKVLQSQGLQR